RVDGRVDLNAVGVFEDGAGRVLIAMHAAHNPVRHCGGEVGRQKKRVPNHINPVPHADVIAVANLCDRKIIPAEQLNQGHVTGRIETDEHTVIELAVVQTALHERAKVADDVKVGDSQTVLTDQHAGSAAGTIRVENGH